MMPITKGIAMRPYQYAATSDTLNSLATLNAVMLQAPTGAGKTVIMGEICRKCHIKGYPVLILAHREELLLQASDKLFKQFGLYSGIIKSGVTPMMHLPIQVASVQTYVNRMTQIRFTPKVIIVDEAHHATAETYQAILKYYPHAKIIGLTATPYRLDGTGFTEIFQKLVVTTTVKHLEELGFLVPARCFSYPIDNTKLDNVAIVKGDYDEKQIADLMAEAQIIEDMVASYKDKAMGKRAICFAVNIEHSKKIVARFNMEGIPAAHIDANSKDRALLIKKFEKGELLFLSNVGIATEGTDIPGIEAVLLARPTKSLSLFLQICGRGSRTAPNKTEYILLDFANCIIDHGRPNKEHDWLKHFKGTRKKGEKKSKPMEKQFKIKLPTGEEYEGSRYDIPAGIKGVVLEEIDEEELIQRRRWRMFENELDGIKFKTKKDGTSFSPFAAVYKWSDALRKAKLLPPNMDELKKIATRLNVGERWISKTYYQFNPQNN